MDRVAEPCFSAAAMYSASFAIDDLASLIHRAITSAAAAFFMPRRCIVNAFPLP
jgi:hypothetical protein